MNCFSPMETTFPSTPRVLFSDSLMMSYKSFIKDKFADKRKTTTTNFRRKKENMVPWEKSDRN